MDRLVKLLDDNHAPAVVISLTLTAFVIRLVIVAFWMDIPGDGPAKAMYAYNWSKSPFIVTQGVWPPGFLYLTGLFSLIVANPLISIRVLNLILGTLSVPTFYLLVRRIFGHIPALFAAGVLSVLPLHVGLSASSLTDVSFLIEVIIGIYFISKAAEMTSNRKAYLAIALFCLCLAELTRYEAWILMPFFPLYNYWKTKNFLSSFLVTLVLSVPPIGWMIMSHMYQGDFLIGFTGATYNWAGQATYLRALKIVGKISVSQTGWTLVILAFWGMISHCMQGIRKKLNADQVLYITMAGFFWITILIFAVQRGTSFQDRYLLFGLVMSLPFAVAPLLKYFTSDKKLLLGTIGFVFMTFLLPILFVYYPMQDLTRQKPTDIKKVALWLKKSPYREKTILMTRMREKSTFLALYCPEIGPHYPYVGSSGQSHLIYAKRLRNPNAVLKKFVKERRPTLLITSDETDEDQELQRDIVKAYGGQIAMDKPLYKEGDVKVFEIKSIAPNNGNVM